MENTPQPIVSVIIPTYNRARVLGRAITSVLSQNYLELELIIVDDGSTDETKDIVATFDDSRIKYIKHERNRGVGAARNTGIKAASGEIIAFQDSDDEWLHGKLTKQVQALEAAGEHCVLTYCTKVVYGRDANFNRGARRIICVPGPEVTELSGDLRRYLWEHHVISTQTMVIRTKALRQIGGFDTNLYNCEEWDLAIRLSEIGTFAFVDEPLVNTYIQHDSISTVSRKTVFSLLIIANKLKRRGVPSSVLAERLASIGYRLGRLGQPRRGAILLGASLSARPLHLKSWVRLLRNHMRRIAQRD